MPENTPPAVLRPDLWRVDLCGELAPDRSACMSELAFRSWRCQAVLDREVDMEEP